MKKALCIVLIILTLLSFCSMSIFAATENSNPSVMEDLATLSVDGKSFSEADYPIDSNDKKMYLLTVVEKGFVNTSVSTGFAFYVYIYNPSSVYFIDREDNSVQIGVNTECEGYSFYRAKLQSISNDRRFVKFRVLSYGGIDVANLYKNQKQANERVYNIAGIRLCVDGKLTAYQLDESYFFSGYDRDGSLQCASCDLASYYAELHDTNWISPNAGAKVDGSPATIVDHYEINSVYFSVPESYFTNYGFLSSIRANFDVLRLTPIVVANKNATGIDAVTAEAIKNGTVISTETDYDVQDLVAIHQEIGSEIPSWVYTESSYLRRQWVDATILNSLAYYFEVDLPEDFDFENGKYSEVAVSSEDLEAYFYDRYNNPTYDNSKLYTSKKNHELDYTAGELFNLKSYTTDLSKFRSWWLKVHCKDDSYIFEDFNIDVDPIYVIENPMDYANISSANHEAVANELLIGVNDVADFSKFCRSVASKGERVVLLRFAYSDYKCETVYDFWDIGVNFLPPVAMSVEKWAYMNISLCHLVFKTDDIKYVIPVVSTVVDSFGDTVIYEDPTDKNGPLPDKDDGDDDPNWWDKLLLVLKIVGVVLLVLILVPVLVILFRLLWKLIRGPAKLAEWQKKQEDKKQKKHEEKENGGKRNE